MGYEIFVMLFVAALVAGFIDSIAGGGGIITIPALLSVGIPPHFALGTNKFQSSFGVFAASLQFYLKGYLRFKENIFRIIILFAFAALGALCVQIIDAALLKKILPFLLIAFGFYFLFSPRLKEVDSKARFGNLALGAVLGAIGFYDGFFGPGTGSFFMLAMLWLGGFGLTKSLAHAKLFNLITNLASLCMFIASGYVLFEIGICMALGQFIGGALGARMAISHGVKIIKPLAVIMSFLMSINLLREYL